MILLYWFMPITPKFKWNSINKLTGGLVLSKAPIAILKPAPSPISTFSFGILTSSKVIPLVSEHLWPMFISCQHNINIDDCFVFYCERVAAKTKMFHSHYLPANLNSWSVSFHNKTSERFGSWAFRIWISACKEEIPKTFLKKKQKGGHKLITRGQINKSQEQLSYSVQYIFCQTCLNCPQGSILVRKHCLQTSLNKLFKLLQY